MEYLEKSNTNKIILKKLILKKDMQSIWYKLWDRDKHVENKLKIITKLILKKN